MCINSNIALIKLSLSRGGCESFTSLLHKSCLTGRSQKWPKEGVLRPEITKGGGIEGAEVLQIRARASFC